MPIGRLASAGQRPLRGQYRPLTRHPIGPSEPPQAAREPPGLNGLKPTGQPTAQGPEPAHRTHVAPAGLAAVSAVLPAQRA